MRNKHQVIEEPDEVKVSRPVLEARQGDDTLTLASGTWVIDPNASGDSTATLAGAILSEQVGSVNEESSHF